jgi:hypothetical protein
MLLVIPFVWLAVASVGLGACRPASLSDASHAHAVGEWLIYGNRSATRAGLDDGESPAAESDDRRYGAAG